jgi:hypothetical protein
MPTNVGVHGKRAHDPGRADVAESEWALSALSGTIIRTTSQEVPPWQ